MQEVGGAGAPLHRGICRLGLLDGLVVLVPRGDLARQVVVDARQPLGQDPQIILDLGCVVLATGGAPCQCCAGAAELGVQSRTFLLLVLCDAAVDFLALLAQILDAWTTVETFKPA